MNGNSALFGRIQLQHVSVNNLIQWGDHLSVGHAGIDAQHRAIFDLGVHVFENWRRGGDVDELRKTVGKLAHLLQAHFAYEERLLAELGYPGLAEHMAEHHSMLDDLALMQERFQDLQNGHPARGGSLLAPGWSVMQFILAFTIGHVMNSDMAYCQAIDASRDFVQGTA